LQQHIKHPIYQCKVTKNLTDSLTLDRWTWRPDWASRAAKWSTCAEMQRWKTRKSLCPCHLRRCCRHNHSLNTDYLCKYGTTQQVWPTMKVNHLQNNTTSTSWPMDTSNFIIENIMDR